MKYSPELTATICDLLATGKWTVADVCRQVGISEAVFYKWKADAEKVEFLEAIKSAEKQRLVSLGEMAKSGLAKLLDVYEYEETQTEYVDKGGKRTIKSQKVTKKRVMPHATAVIFALKNREADDWKDKQHIDVRDTSDPLSKLTDEELLNEIRRLAPPQ